MKLTFSHIFTCLQPTPKPAHLPYSCLVFFSLLSATAHTQDNSDIGRLLFEPVPIQVERIGENDYIVTEIDLSLTSNTQTNNAQNSSTSIQEYTDAALKFLVTPESTDTTEYSVESYMAIIQELETEGGPYDSRLSQELSALALNQLALGDTDTAIETFMQAKHITRVNNGLFSLQQEPIITDLIRAYLLKGDLNSADAQYEHLFYLHTKIYEPSSPEYLASLGEYAQWHILALNLRQGLDPSTINQLNYRLLNNSSASFAQQTDIAERLLKVQGIYSNLTQLIKVNTDFNSSLLLDLEKSIAFTNYFFAAVEFSPPTFSSPDDFFQSDISQSNSTGFEARGNSAGYRLGRDALLRRINYIRELDGLPNDALGNAMLDLADWYLSFNKRRSALSIYLDAYNELAAHDIPPARIDALFQPQLSIQVPLFLAPRYSRTANKIPLERELEYKGYIDVELVISRFGVLNYIEVLGRSDTTNNLIQRRLLRHLRNATFRPRMTEGIPVEDDRAQVRYYYTY